MYGTPEARRFEIVLDALGQQDTENWAWRFLRARWVCAIWGAGIA
ncbi:hypothetical protein BJB45_08720 [Halomonas huangheensis]|uniref:Uncharacterized protein n=1 Tax=Halomonas huangheensis TaxID=1178482 RepID=W1NAT3_9GAMM|nr:hypothetical protein BJB45_08720 [Halomonas huangheensis]